MDANLKIVIAGRVPAIHGTRIESGNDLRKAQVLSSTRAQQWITVTRAVMTRLK